MPSVRIAATPETSRDVSGHVVYRDCLSRAGFLSLHGKPGHRASLRKRRSLVSGLWAASAEWAHRCRYYPTCSEYSIEAVREYGVRRGLVLTVTRIKSCTINVPLGTHDPLARRN